MKKIVLILIAISVIAGSCRYKEGPVISFRSVHDRLVGTWTVTGYTSDGIDSLEYFNDSCGCKVEFPSPTNTDMNYELLFLHCYNTQRDVDCMYNFSKNKKIMSIYLKNELSLYGFKSYGPMLKLIDWNILRLTKDDYKISANTDGHNYVVTFKKTN